MDYDTRIETERLRLRLWREGDFEQYERACNTPNVMRWLGGVQTRSQIKADMFFFSDSLTWHNVTFWVVERQSDDVFLGFCGLVQIPDRDCPIAKTFEIGWRLREDVWRQGYGYEAASAVLDLAFEEKRVETVYSRAAPGNTASRKLMSKLGLTRRREFDYVPLGEGDKLLVYSISMLEWRARHNIDI